MGGGTADLGVQYEEKRIKGEVGAMRFDCADYGVYEPFADSCGVRAKDVGVDCGEGGAAEL